MFVTHDLEEVIALSDEVVELSAGPASVEIYRSIWRDLREEVLKSYERFENA